MMWMCAGIMLAALVILLVTGNAGAFLPAICMLMMVVMMMAMMGGHGGRSHSDRT